MTIVHRERLYCCTFWSYVEADANRGRLVIVLAVVGDTHLSSENVRLRGKPLWHACSKVGKVLMCPSLLTTWCLHVNICHVHYLMSVRQYFLERKSTWVTYSAVSDAADTDRLKANVLHLRAVIASYRKRWEQQFSINNVDVVCVESQRRRILGLLIGVGSFNFTVSSVGIEWAVSCFLALETCLQSFVWQGAQGELHSVWCKTIRPIHMPWILFVCLTWRLCCQTSVAANIFYCRNYKFSLHY